MINDDEVLARCLVTRRDASTAPGLQSFPRFARPSPRPPPLAPLTAGFAFLGAPAVYLKIRLDYEDVVFNVL